MQLLASSFTFFYLF